VRLSDVLREVSESLSVLEPEPTRCPRPAAAVPDSLPPSARRRCPPRPLPADTVPTPCPGLPALEPVGADGPAPLRAHAAAPTSVHAVRDVVAA
jgi:hypothetical protein